MSKFDEIQSQYKDGILTTEGYILLSLESIAPSEIDLADLSECLELPYSTTRDTILRLRREGKIVIPTRKGKRSSWNMNYPNRI
jgi:hypothetical protein